MVTVITCGVMDVGLSDGVDQAGVQGVVHVGGVGVGNGGGVWQGIAVVTLVVAMVRLSVKQFFERHILCIIGLRFEGALTRAP